MIDLSKAFDTVDHTILLKKLFCYGFRDTSFDWCKSYLECRQQCVNVNGTLSDFLEEKPFGVPQGSVLGPLFFLLYINNIQSAILSSYFHLYADDTIIIQGSNDLQDLIYNLESELSNVDNWLTLNKLTPNVKKCESIFFAKPQSRKLCKKASIKFRGYNLDNKECFKHLGVYFDNKLSWEKHVKEVIRKINFKLSKIRPLAKFLDPVDINMLIQSFVKPYVHYCSTTWSSAAPHLINKIQTTINKTHFFSTHVKNINVENCLKYDMAMLSFKAINNLTPVYISDSISLVSSHHKYFTRQSRARNIFHKHLPNKLSTQSLASMATKVWNPLPVELKTENSLLLFKNKCKKYFQLF